MTRDRLLIKPNMKPEHHEHRNMVTGTVSTSEHGHRNIMNIGTWTPEHHEHPDCETAELPKYLDPVYTLPDPCAGHDINLNSFKTSVALKFVIILQNLIKINHRKSGKSKYDRKLTELNVVTTRIQ